MKTEAYIVKDGEVIDEIKTALKNDTTVEYSTETSYDALRQCSTLVNVSHGKISRAQKYWHQANAFGNTTYIGKCLEKPEIRFFLAEGGPKDSYVLMLPSEY